MNKTIWLLFERLRAIIMEKLLNPEVLKSPRGRTFFYYGTDSEEEFEVAVTCRINTDGQLIGIPAWKPYTGPRR